ncbi:hypothetical protein [Clostridium thermarum]|uniref:hypothetical protein n=1 Tax=Clostridium thermarum TaxID=1716543 RepID=UPI0013D8D32B|nr:hypothetical protein [Clostridium thermarum]
MHKYSVHKMKDGSVALYVLLVGTLILLTVTAGFKFQLDRYKDLQYKRQRLETTNTINFKKEKLFSDFYGQLKVKTTITDIVSILQSLRYDNSWVNFRYEDATLTFNKDKDLLVLTYPYNSIKNCTEYYSIYPTSIGVKFNLVHSKFTTR